MDKTRKNSFAQRLNIIAGQVNGLARLIENNDSCQKVTSQFYAINSGLKKTIELYLKENMDYCLKGIKLDGKKRINFLLKEIIKNK